jgi:hypothetical protein
VGASVSGQVRYTQSGSSHSDNSNFYNEYGWDYQSPTTSYDNSSNSSFSETFSNSYQNEYHITYDASGEYHGRSITGVDGGYDYGVGSAQNHSEYSQQYPAAEGGYSYGTTSDGTVDNSFNYTEGWTKDWITGQNPSQVIDRMNGSETLSSNWDYGTPQTFTLNQTEYGGDGFGGFAGDYNQGPAIYQGPGLPTNKSVGGGAWQTAPGGGPSLLSQMPANNGVSLSTAMTHQAVNGGSSSFSTTNTTPPGAAPSTSVAPTGAYAEADPHLTACFRKGMIVEMSDESDKATGTKEIERVEEGETIFAVPENDPEAKPRGFKVKRVFHNEPRPLLGVTINGKVLYCTFEHRCYVRGKGWIPAKEMKPGDNLRAPSGEPVIVEAVEDTGITEAVFNLEIEGAHTYFVGTPGRESVLVHNTSGIERLDELLSNPQYSALQKNALKLAYLITTLGNQIYDVSNDLETRRNLGSQDYSSEADRQNNENQIIQDMTKRHDLRIEFNAALEAFH